VQAEAGVGGNGGGVHGRGRGTAEDGGGSAGARGSGGARSRSPRGEEPRTEADMAEFFSECRYNGGVVVRAGAGNLDGTRCGDAGSGSGLGPSLNSNLNPNPNHSRDPDPDASPDLGASVHNGGVVDRAGSGDPDGMRRSDAGSGSGLGPSPNSNLNPDPNPDLDLKPDASPSLGPSLSPDPGADYGDGPDLNPNPNPNLNPYPRLDAVREEAREAARRAGLRHKESGGLAGGGGQAEGDWYVDPSGDAQTMMEATTQYEWERAVRQQGGRQG
jgi:hypothetical protein